MIGHVTRTEASGLGLLDRCLPRLVRGACPAVVVTMLLFLTPFTGQQTEQIFILVALLGAGLICALIPIGSHAGRSFFLVIAGLCSGTVTAVFVLHYLEALIESFFHGTEILGFLLAEAPKHLAEVAPEELSAVVLLAALSPWMRPAYFRAMLGVGSVLAGVFLALDPPGSLLELARNTAFLSVLVVPPLAARLDGAVMRWLASSAEAHLNTGDSARGLAKSRGLALAYPEEGLPRLIVALAQIDAGQAEAALHSLACARAAGDLTERQWRLAVSCELGLLAMRGLGGEVLHATAALDPVCELFFCQATRGAVPARLLAEEHDLSDHAIWIVSWLPWEAPEARPYWTLLLGEPISQPGNEKLLIETCWPGATTANEVLDTLSGKLAEHMATVALLAVLSEKRGEEEEARELYALSLEIPARPSVYSAFAQLRLQALPTPEPPRSRLPGDR